MSAQVTLKMTAEEFDAIRKIVQIAAKDAKTKMEKSNHPDDRALWFDFKQMCTRLLDHTLS